MINAINGFNAAKSGRAFLVGSGLMACSGQALFFVLLAWAVGGSEFKDSFYGDAAMVVFGVGLIVGALLAALNKEARRDH